MTGLHAPDRRNTRAAHRFLSKAATTMRDWPPTSITTDRCPSYPEAIARLTRDSQFPRDTGHRTSKYLNNIIEADHGGLKQVIKPTRGFQTMETATATIKGFEIMRMIRRGRCLTCKRGVERGVPKVVFCDKGSEFTSHAMDLWAYQNGAKIDFSRPGKPTDNAFVESFNGTFRSECLNTHWFMNLKEVLDLFRFQPARG
jgi:hypothetical protein